MLKSKSYIILIALVLILLPILHLFTVKWGFNQSFNNDSEVVLFLFYHAPLWLLFIAIISVELYRKAVLGLMSGYSPIYTMSVGAVLLAITGIVISPVGPDLVSVVGVRLIGTNTVLCAIAALVIQQLLRNQMGKQ